MTSRELFRFGLVADIQYADVNDAMSHDFTALRKYRGSLRNLKQAVETFREELFSVDEAHPPFILQLGDIIDGQNRGDSGQLKGKEPQSEKALETVLSVFESIADRIKVYHSIGNHELYNFSWKELEQKLNTRNNQVSEDGTFYFSFKPCMAWRVIHLNSYEISLCQNEELEGYKQAASILERENPNYPEFVNYFRGLRRNKLHFSPLNGGLSEEQLKWVEGQLSDAQRNGEMAIVTAHIPLTTRSSNPKTKILNAEELTKIFDKYPGVVKLFLSGHCHEGGYFFDKKRKIAHLTVPSALNYNRSYGIVTVTESKIIIDGTGGLKSREISLGS